MYSVIKEAGINNVSNCCILETGNLYSDFVILFWICHFYVSGRARDRFVYFLSLLPKAKTPDRFKVAISFSVK